MPPRAASAVGISPTQELVSRDGMIQHGINTRVGPICRNVEDAARVLQVIAGYDPKDELTVFGMGRMPEKPYDTFARAARLDGVTIGVVREYMDKTLFTEMDAETIDIVDKAVADMRTLGATIVDPGATRTAMRAKAYPGEDPASVKPPEAVAARMVALLGEQFASPHRERVNQPS